MCEIEQIKKRYARRKQLPADKYSYFNPGNLFMVQERERAVLSLLRRYGMTPLTERKILDVGCGTGGWLLDFVRWGARPENLFGVELLEERVREARGRVPRANLINGNAEQLPFTDEIFDIVLQSTVFTSIHDALMKSRIAQEMIRVLKKGGLLLWYDFRYNNPWNPDVRGVNKTEIDRLFEGLPKEYHTITLAPPIVRRLALHSWLACYLLSGVPFLRTHYLVAMQK